MAAILFRGRWVRPSSVLRSCITVPADVQASNGVRPNQFSPFCYFLYFSELPRRWLPMKYHVHVDRCRPMWRIRTWFKLSKLYYIDETPNFTPSTSPLCLQWPLRICVVMIFSTILIRHLDAPLICVLGLTNALMCGNKFNRISKFQR